MNQQSSKGKSRGDDKTSARPDLEKFRLRRFVEELRAKGEVDVIDKPVQLGDVSPIIEATPKAVLFRSVGPERSELVSTVMGSRKRMALALGVAEEDSAREFLRRLETPQSIVEVSSVVAPVHQVVLTGKKADISKLPFHPHHEYDGGVYLTSGIDFTVDPETGWTNIGCRRLCLHGRYECTTNVTSMSHLRFMYQRSMARKERLPVSFAVGSHPVDFLASGMRAPRGDELKFLAALRGEPVPLVKSVTNDILVPADAEIIVEGYLDERGYIEPDGPYGEYMGYYGPMHLDPIFHVTAITMRKDALHQSLLHGVGRILGRSDAALISAVRLEAEAIKLLTSIGIDAVAAYQPLYGGEMQHMRVAIRQTVAGQARHAIAMLFGAILSLKHIFIVDEDIDVRSDDAMDWALGTRFQANRDLIVLDDMHGMRMDPSLDGKKLGSKAGFDCTRPVGRSWSVTSLVPAAKQLAGKKRFKTVEDALGSGPMFFTHLMEAVGSRDGRDVSLALNELRSRGKIGRDADGRYHLAKAEKGRTAIIGPIGHDPQLDTILGGKAH